MKDTMKFDRTAEQIRDELTVANAGASFDSAFRRGYERVAELPAPKARRRPGRIIGFASSCAATLVLGMFVLNMANPVLAEGLPLVGGIFKMVNASPEEGTIGSNNLVIDDLQNVAQLPADADQKELYVKGAGTLDTGLTLQVGEFYYDGSFLHLGSEIIFDQMPAGVTDVLIEGEISFDGKQWYSYGTDKAPYLSELDPVPFRMTDGRFLHTLSFQLPAEYQERESLAVQLRVTAVSCLAEDGAYSMEENARQDVISLQAARGAAENIQELNTPLTVNGITLKSAAKAFTGVTVSFEGLPYAEDVHPAIMSYLADGDTPGGASLSDTPDTGKESLLVTTHEDVVIFTIRNKQSDSLEVLAEFTVDFGQGTITATRHYLDPDGPSYYDLNDFTYGYFRDGAADTDFYLNRVFASDEKMGYISVGTGLDYRPLRIEAYRDGELVADVRTAQDDESAEEPAAVFQPNGPDAGSFTTGKGEYNLITVHDGTNYALSEQNTLTVKVYDGATDELLYEETQPLNQKYYF